MDQAYNETIAISELIDLNEKKTLPFVKSDDANPDDTRDPIKYSKKKRKISPYNEEEEAAIVKAKSDGNRISGGRTSRKIISSARGADVSEISFIRKVFDKLDFLVFSTNEKSEAWR